MSRRDFLRASTLGAAAVAAGLVPRPAGAAWWRRSPGARAGGRLRLVFYTDVHARTEWETPRALDLAAAAVNRCRPDLVIAGGDLITEGFESSAEAMAPRWDAYMRLHRGIGAEIHAVVGNHDLVAAMPRDGSPPADDPRREFRSRFGLANTYRSFDAAGYHIVLLDATFVTGDELKYEGRIGPEQMDWLREDLSGVAAEAPIVLVSHMPLLTTFYQSTAGMMEQPPRNRVVVNSKDVLDLFSGRNMVLVLQGHLHVEELIRWRGATVITGGAVCGRWWRGAYHGTKEGFGVVALDGGRVGWEYVGYGWDARRPAGS